MPPKVRQGWAPGLAPYGYQNVAGNKEEPIQPHPINAIAVQRIFELYSSGCCTFHQIADAMEREGYTYQPAYPRFHRTALSYILNNRFYVGMVTFRGQTYAGKHKPIVDLEVFGQCQNLLQGKNRRVREANHYLAGGMFQCAHCGFGITGERIVRRMKSGKTHEYIYYRCGNLDPAPDHPVVRWRQDQLEEAIHRDLLKMRIPDDRRREWLETSLVKMCDDQARVLAEQHRGIRKRLVDIEHMQQRLLDGYLAGGIEKDVFTAKTTELKIETERLRQRLTDATVPDGELKREVQDAFEFSQKAADLWTVSGTDARRQILTRALLKRSLSDVSLVTTKRKPFDVLIEGPFFDESRGDCPSFEPAGFAESYLRPFLAPPTPYEAAAVKLARRSA